VQALAAYGKSNSDTVAVLQYVAQHDNYWDLRYEAVETLAGMSS
jgi:hypothetical protein